MDAPLRSASAGSMGQKGTIGQNYKDRIPVCNGICFGIHLDGLQLFFRSATAGSMGQYIDKSNRRVRWALILANR